MHTRGLLQPCLTLIFLRHGLSLSLCVTDIARLSSQGASGPPVLGLRYLPAQLFHVGVRGMHSGPRPCLAGIYSIVPCPACLLSILLYHLIVFLLGCLCVSSPFLLTLEHSVSTPTLPQQTLPPPPWISLTLHCVARVSKLHGGHFKLPICCPSLLCLWAPFQQECFHPLGLT